ncbi:MAG: thiamine pyrophosphate-binding protein [Proteobacteria bacterium]|nr:thiamine pyrophosphate-binding protein [Pseudomonadota bacterium]
MKKTGGQIAAETLREKGVKQVFTLSGGHISPIYKFLEEFKITLFDTRHEQSAVFMAEAYGRMQREPGVAMVTAGPGFTNALSAVANAYMANSPLLLIAGCVGVESVEKLDLQDMHQAPVIEPMVKKALVCHKAERIAEFIDMAYRIAITGRPGPVYLELPIDILKTEVDDSAVKRINNKVSSHPADPDQAEEMLKMLAAAKQPIIIAGSGAWYADAGAELTEFAEKTGVPTLTMAGARGIMPDTHPLCFESATAIRPGAALIADTGADLVLFLGSRLSLLYIFGDIFNKEAKFVQVDIHPDEIGRNRNIDLGIISDIKGLLKVCNRRLDEMGTSEKLKKQFAPWLETVKAADKDGKEQSKPLWESENTPIHPMRLAHEVNTFMNKKSDIVIADGGDTQIWMGMTRTVVTPGTYMDSGLYGCLAVGLPYTNTAKFLNPKSRVCLIIGDGSTGFNFMEFETAIRKGLNIVVVISNDLGWGMIRHSQELAFGKAIEDGTFIGSVPYHKLVEDLGGKGFYVEKPEDIAPALKEAFACGKVACVNVMTDPTTVSPGSVALANLGSYSA